MELRRIRILLIIGISLLASAAYGVEDPAASTPTYTPASTSAPAPTPAPTQTESDQEHKFQALGNYAPLDLIVPSKIGASFAYFTDPHASLELEYLYSSIQLPLILKDLGQIQDYRLSLIRRHYIAEGTFNLFYGIAYHDFTLKIGNQILERIPNAPEIGSLKVGALGGVIGIGTRWVFGERFIAGIDWLSWSQAFLRVRNSSTVLQTITDQGDREKLEKAFSYASFLPRFSVAKLQIGISF
jgi:hypothetical protein